MKQYVKKKFEQLLLKEKSVKRLAASFCFGTFMAFTATIPLQTWLAIAFAWVLRLNIAIVVAAVYLVNNPLTLIPIYAVGYAVGSRFFTILGIDAVAYNPWWIDTFNNYLSRYIDISQYLGSDLCFWCLVVGSVLLGLMISIPLYPLLLRVLTKLADELETQKSL